METGELNKKNAVWRTEPDPLRKRALARLVARSGGSTTHPSSIPGSDLGVSPRGYCSYKQLLPSIPSACLSRVEPQRITTRPSSTELVDSGDLKKDTV